MNELLRIQVERAVRPVYASFERKLRMREELGSLIAAIHAEETEKTKDPDEAIQTTLQRFGDPDALRTELQGTVGRVEMLLNRIFANWERGPHESPFGYAGRVALLNVALLALVVLATEVLMRLFHHEGLSPLRLRVLAGISGMFFVNSWILLWLGLFTCTTLKSNEWRASWKSPRPWVAGGLAALAMMITNLLLVASMGGTQIEIASHATTWI